MFDVCVHTYCRRDVELLGVFLYSLEKLADPASCNILVSCGSSDPAVREALTGICESRPARSLYIDFFAPTEMVDSNQHGEGLNRLFVRTASKYVVVADPDVIVTSPGWMDFCRQRIDQGRFIVGMPYNRPRDHWQGGFPTVWLSAMDGDVLRSADLDMRTQHICFDAKSNLWKLSGRSGRRQFRDMGWELADHAFKNGLDWVSFTLGRGFAAGRSRMASDMLSWTNSALSRKVRRRAGKCLTGLNAMEFSYPGTDEMCCAHLAQGGLYGVGTHRSDRWIACAKMAVDMYAGSM